MELLLCCARTQIGAEAADRISALARQETDWPRLVEMALWNGVASLLYRTLSATCADAVPADVLGQLKDRYRANAVRSLLMSGELLRLLGLLDANGIRAIPIKGPVLAASAYGDVALREFCDLDVLVHRRDLRRARRLLTAQGYGSYRWNLEHPDSGLTVELHRWDFTKRDPAGPSGRPEGSDRLPTVLLLDSAVPSLPPEDMLLVLCTHGSKHCWDRLSLVCDLAQFISTQPETDWTAVLERATRTGSRRRLLWGLLLEWDMLGVPVPREVSVSAAADSRLMPLVAEARRRILCAQPAAFGNDERWSTHLRMMERRRDRMRFCLGLLLEGIRPNRTDRIVVPLPRCLHVLYYLIHPIRVAATYGPRALKRLFRRVP